MSELDPSIDPKQLVNQDTGQVEDKTLAEVGAYAENAKRDYLNDSETQIVGNNTLEGIADKEGTGAMISEVSQRAEKLLSPEVSAELKDKVKAAAEQAFLRELQQIEQRFIEDANAKAEELIRKLEQSDDTETEKRARLEDL